MNSANPPPWQVEEASKLRRNSHRVESGLLLLLLVLCFLGWKYPQALLDRFLLIVALVFGLLIASYRWDKKSDVLLRPFTLTSWTAFFNAPGNVLEIAFQYPPEYASQQLQERVQIATKAALRIFRPEELQQILEAALAPEIDELGIPVFRVQVLSITAVTAPIKDKGSSLYI
jgi:hypothetical protein